jgi:hypothetical protein
VTTSNQRDHALRRGQAYQRAAAVLAFVRPNGGSVSHRRPPEGEWGVRAPVDLAVARAVRRERTPRRRPPASGRDNALARGYLVTPRRARMAHDAVCWELGARFAAVVRILPRRRYATVEITTAYAPGYVLGPQTIDRLWALLQDVSAPRTRVTVGRTFALCPSVPIDEALEIAPRLSHCVRRPGAVRRLSSADSSLFSAASATTSPRRIERQSATRTRSAQVYRGRSACQSSSTRR